MSFLLLLISFSALFSQYDWEDNGLPLRQGVHIEWQRTGDIGGSQDMIFAWSDTRYGGRDVYVQKVDALGNQLWGSEGTPVVIAPGRQEDPILVTDGNGGAYIIWVDYRDEPDDGDIYAQHINSDGVISWDIQGVILTNVTGKQTSLNMASDGNGGAFVIWNDLSVSTLGYTYGTHLTTVESEIIAQGTGVPIIANDSDHSGVSIEKAQQGSAVLVWTDDRNTDTSDLDIYTQRIDSQCNTLWSTPEEGGIPLCQADGIQQYSKVTYYSENESVIVWEDRRYNPNSGDVFVQYVDMNGNILLDPSGQAVSINGANQIKPRVKASSSGAYIVWEDTRNGPADIYVQRNVLGQGNIFDEDGKALCTEPNSQDQPRLTVDGNGGAYVVWMDERYAPFPETEIFMQHINSDGTTSFASGGLSVCEASGYQFNPLVRNDANGNVFAVWGDSRSGSIGLYSQYITPSSGIEFDVDGIELYFGIDGNGLSANSLYLGNDQSLLYWEDRRFGIIADLTYGQKIYNGWENVVTPNGIKLSDNQYQVTPKAETVGDNVFLGFGQAFGDIALHYQLLDQNLTMLGSSQGTPVYESFTPQGSYDLKLSSDGYLFFVFSDTRNFIDSDIYVQKYNSEGTALFNEPVLIVDNFFIDDNVRFVESDNSGGAVIAYDSGDFSGTRAYLSFIDQNGSMNSNARLCSTESDQFIKGLVKLNNGYFVIWKDQRSGSSDIYGQLVDFSGNILGPDDGIAITTEPNDQQAPSVSYNSVDNKVIVCWEDFRNGLDFDIYCSEVDVNDLSNLTTLDVCTHSSNQKSPAVYSTLDGSYLMAWEDSRNGVASDIFFQSISNGNLNHEVNGIVLCDADFNQLDPKIDIYDASANSYMVYWDDLRSSGKEDLKNIYLQSVTINANNCDSDLDNDGVCDDVDSCVQYDINGDGSVNVIDVVSVVNFVLGGSPNDQQFCASDINSDGTINVIDIVSIVNFIISS